MTEIEQNGTGWSLNAARNKVGAMVVAVTLFLALPVCAAPPESATAKLYVYGDAATVVISTRAGSFVGRGRLEEGDFGTVDLTPLRGSSHVMIGRQVPVSEAANAPVEMYVGSGDLTFSDGVSALVGSSGSGFPADSTFSADILQVEDGFGLVVRQEDSTGTRELASGSVSAN